MTGQEHRVQKVEATLFTALTPEQRVNEVLRAAGEGKDDMALRLAELCPRLTYIVRDPAYRERLRNVFTLCMWVIAEFEKYRFAIATVAELEPWLKAHNALCEQDFASVSCAFAVWRKVLQARLQGEWNGFDAFCRSEFHMDSVTVLEGLKMIKVSYPSSETAPAEAEDEIEKCLNEFVTEVAAKREAYWRQTFLELTNIVAKGSKSATGSGT